MKHAARLLVKLFFPRKKMALVIALFLLAWPFLSPIFVQGQSTQQQTLSKEFDPQVPLDQDSQMQGKLINILSAFGCQLTGKNPAHPDRSCLGINQLTGKIGFLPKQPADSQQIGGAIGFVNSMIAATYTPPASSRDYIAYLGENFGVAQKAHAQGVGFTSLSPILPLWTVMRNMAYFFYIVVFVVLGILIMIRVRIDPRTVMTIQNQIPKVVIGLVLITFSYAIAGLLVDLMYVSTYIVGNVITSADPALNGHGDFSGRLLRTTNPISAMDLIADPNDDFHIGLRGITSFAWKTSDGVSNAVAQVFNNVPGKLIMGAISGLIVHYLATAVGTTAGAAGSIIGGLIGVTAAVLAAPSGGASLVLAALAAGATGATLGGNLFGAAGTVAATGVAVAAGFWDADGVVGGVAHIITFIIIAVAILSSLFRLWFILMKAYILILNNIIFGPFYVLFGMFPGSGMNFNTWMRTMTSHLCVFPTTFVMFLLARVVIDGLSSTQKAGIFVPPMVGNASVAGAIQSIVGLTFILMTPSVVDMVRGFFQSKPSPYTAGIGAGAAVGAGFAVGAFKNPLSIMTQAKEVHMTADGKGGVQYGDVGHMRAIGRKFLSGR